MMDTTKPAPDVKSNDVDAVLEERGKRYGKFKNHAEIAQAFKRLTSYYVKKIHDKELGDHLSYSQDEALDMIFHKIARIINGDPNYADSWIDIAGYAKLVADELEGDIR